MLGVVLFWFLVLELFSLVSFPLAYRAFSRLPDRGWAFSKPLGLLLVGLGTWMIGLTHTIPNSRWTVLLALVIVGVLSWAAVRRHLPEMRAFVREHASVIVAAELLFAAVFLGFTLLRASISDISGTEQPMDLMFLNATVTSPFYPPNDPWLAGQPVSYYYLGYLMIGALTMFTGIGVAIAYNLGLATAAALAAIAAFGVTFNLVRLARGSVDGAVFGGIAAAFLLLVASSLVGTLELVRAAGIGGDGFWSNVGIDGLTEPDGPSPTWAPVETHLWWWRISRVVPGGINEFPLFSFLLGDLHPHVMSIGFVLLTVGVAIQIYLQTSLLTIGIKAHSVLLTAALALFTIALADFVLLDAGLVWLFAVAALIAVGSLGPLWPLGLVLVASTGALGAINLWDLPLGAALVVGALLLNAARNERSMRFGETVAIDGDTMIAGAPADSAIGAGSAAVYLRARGRWRRDARLHPPTPLPGAGFGASVALHGGLAAVGAPRASGQGVVYLFERSGGQWRLRTTLRPPEGQRASAFGRSLAVEAGVVAVGADDAVYVFEGADMLWSLRAKLGAESGASDFGHAIDLEDGTLVVGAPGGAGAVGVYRRDDTRWALSHRLDAGDENAGVSHDEQERFGQSLSLRGGHLAIGSVGTVSVRQLSNGAWKQEALLRAPEPTAAHTFGSAVATAHWYLTVGAPGGPGGRNAAGAAFIYEHDGGNWALHSKVNSRDVGGDGVFGSSLAMAEDTVVTGAPGSGQGAAFVYERSLDRWSLAGKIVARWRLARALAGSALLVGAMLLAFAPFYDSFDSNAKGILPLENLVTRPLHLLLIWGVSGFLVLPVLALILKRVFVRPNWNLMRFSLAAFAGFTPLMFWLQPIYTIPLYTIAVLLFAIHQAGYRMPKTDEMLFAYNPRLTLGIGGTVVVAGFIWDGIFNSTRRGLDGELIAIDRLLIVVPMAIVVSLAIYGSWTLAHRDSEALRFAGPGDAPRTQSDAFVPVLMFLGIATSLVMGVELFHVADIFAGGDFRRLNTMFKLHYQAWLLLAVLGGFGLWYVGSRWDRKVLAGRVGVAAWTALLIVALGAVSYYPLAAITSRSGNGSPGLDIDGQAYILRTAPSEHAAIQWIRDNVARDAVVVESAVVPCPNEPNGCHSYSEAGRIASSTGRPTIIGWLGHERQWRSTGLHGDLDTRAAEVREIYETTDAAVAHGLLAKYDAAYLVIGPRERRAYGTAGAAKFAELGPLVFPSGPTTAADVLIYELAPGGDA
jgi:uncharacterized membrane protein